MSCISWREKATDALPAWVAFAFMGLSIGALAHHAGVSVWQTFWLTVCLSAVPLVVIVLHMAQHGVILSVLAVISLMVNFRLFLMSATLMPYFEGAKLWQLLLVLPFLGGTTFALPFFKRQNQPDLNTFQYYRFIVVTGLLCLLIPIFLGFYVSHAVASPVLLTWLIMILPIQFATLIAKSWPRLRPVMAAVCGFVGFPFVQQLSPDFSVFIVPLLVGVFFLGWREKAGE